MADAADISLANIADAIETTLGAAAGMVRTQSYDEVRATVRSGDAPLLQVYPQSGATDLSGTADRSSFQAGVRQRELMFHADLYARKRSHLHDDMKAVTEMIEAICDVLEVQDTKPYFDLAGIKAFAWRWERTIFDTTGQSDDQYMGARFFLTIRVF